MQRAHPARPRPDGDPPPPLRASARPASVEASPRRAAGRAPARRRPGRSRPASPGPTSSPPGAAGRRLGVAVEREDQPRELAVVRAHRRQRLLRRARPPTGPRRSSRPSRKIADPGRRCAGAGARPASREGSLPGTRAELQVLLEGDRADARCRGGPRRGPRLASNHSGRSSAKPARRPPSPGSAVAASAVGGEAQVGTDRGVVARRRGRGRRPARRPPAARSTSPCSRIHASVRGAERGSLTRGPRPSRGCTARTAAAGSPGSTRRRARPGSRGRTAAARRLPQTHAATAVAAEDLAPHVLGDRLAARAGRLAASACIMSMARSIRRRRRRSRSWIRAITSSGLQAVVLPEEAAPEHPPGAPLVLGDGAPAPSPGRAGSPGGRPPEMKRELATPADTKRRRRKPGSKRALVSSRSTVARHASRGARTDRGLSRPSRGGFSSSSGRIAETREPEAAEDAAAPGPARARSGSRRCV